MYVPPNPSKDSEDRNGIFKEYTNHAGLANDRRA